MPFLLFAIFLKGPLWLRLFTLMGLGILVLFGCLYSYNKTHDAMQRTAPTHVQHHYKPTHILRG